MEKITNKVNESIKKITKFTLSLRATLNLQEILKKKKKIIFKPFIISFNKSFDSIELLSTKIIKHFKRFIKLRK